MERATRYSKKREAILNAIRATDIHPSAEWVYQTLKPAHPDLSLGTVYRNLSLFQQQGLIQSVGVVNGQERFDGVAVPHSHFICRCCGAVMDLHRVKLDPAIDRSVVEEYGLAVERHELTFYGCCQDCMAKEEHQRSTREPACV